MGLINDICTNENIKIISVTEENAETLTRNSNNIGYGEAVLQGDKKYILYDRTAPIWEKKFTISHEIAHHLFGHLRLDSILTAETREMEANIFASVLVALMLYKEYENKID